MLRRRRQGPDHKRKALALTGISAAVLSSLGLLRRRTKHAEVDSKGIVRKLFEGTWQGSLGVIDQYVAPGYTGHDPSQPTPIRGIDGMKEFIQRFRDAFSSTRITIEEQIAEGDTVATRWTGRGTHVGEISGIAPTGKDVTIAGTSISRVENGKLVEDHTSWDTLGLLVQLGAVPAPAEAPAEDVEYAAEHPADYEHHAEHEHHPYEPY